MRRKKLILSVFLAAAGITSAMAQLDNSSKFYIKAYGGYGLITPGSYKLVINVNTPDGTNTDLSKNGLGKGIRAGGGLGVVVSDFMNIGADVEYLSGASLESTSNYIGSNYVYFDKTKISYTALSLTPHVIFKALSKPDYLIYNKLGILFQLPFDMKYTAHDSSNSNGSITTYDNNGVYKIGMTVGLNVALGVQYRLTDNLRAFGEVFANYLVLSPKTYELTRKTVQDNGAPVIEHQLTTYIDKGKLESTYPTPTESRSTAQVAYSRFNMHAIGINIGVSYRF